MQGVAMSDAAMATTANLRVVVPDRLAVVVQNGELLLRAKRGKKPCYASVLAGSEEEGNLPKGGPLDTRFR